METREDAKPSVLQPEVEYFEAHKGEWLKEFKDQFVLVKNQQKIAVFSSYQDAVNDGFRRFGNQPFLVKQILEKEIVERIPALYVGAISAYI